ncbi:MAG: hypothetical protein F6K47_08010 [Symploca sp. SIO2E6]|nr:hypothetical protein [Symploca sp. SIO2E6]
MGIGNWELGIGDWGLGIGNRINTASKKKMTNKSASPSAFCLLPPASCLKKAYYLSLAIACFLINSCLVNKSLTVTNNTRS